MISNRITACALALAAACSLGSHAAYADTNYHLVGWFNTFVPGSGQALMGNYGTGAAQAAFEVGTFVPGLFLSGGGEFSLDGFVSLSPTFRLRRSGETSIERNIAGDMLQELGLKTHMVNTFNAYRQAARRPDGSLPSGIDGESTWDMFLEPFDGKNLTNPWVYAPILATLAYCIYDYASTTKRVGTYTRVTPTSNALYTLNYGVWQPFGSGAPEEMFFRGFLQNEMLNIVPSPWFAIPISTLAFAFSHAAGPGRYSAGVAGGYLGILAYRYDGRLGPGIAAHFWSDMLLGLETILLYQKGQGTTPPTAFTVQVNY